MVEGQIQVKYRKPIGICTYIRVRCVDHTPHGRTTEGILHEKAYYDVLPSNILPAGQIIDFPAPEQANLSYQQILGDEICQCRTLCK